MSESNSNFQTVLNEITTVIQTYQAESTRLNIAELLEMQDRLVTLRFTLAESVANFKHGYLAAAFKRKIAVDISQRAYMAQFINRKGQVSEAKVNANIANQDVIQDEMSKEALAYKAEILWKTSGQVADTMRQRIAHLRNELTNIQ